MMNIPVPPIGWRVHYFPDGDLANPVPGDVMTVGQWIKEGQMPVLALNYQQRNSANLQFARTVRHKDDPFLQDHAELSKFNIQGTWDYIPGLVPPPTPRPVEKKEEPKKQLQGVK